MTETPSQPAETTPSQEYTLEELGQYVIKAIAEVKEVPEDTIKLQNTFEELEVDSLDAMEMLFLMEEKFDVNMPDTAVRAMRNVEQVADALDKLLKGEELEIPEDPEAQATMALPGSDDETQPGSDEKADAGGAAGGEAQAEAPQG